MDYQPNIESPESCVYKQTFYSRPYKPGISRYPCRFCDSPANFCSSEREEALGWSDLFTTFQDQILCATCVYSIDNALTFYGVQSIRAMDVKEGLLFRYAGGAITFAGMVYEPVTQNTPVGTRRIFLSVPLILSLGGETDNFMQLNASFAAILLPGQCPQITPASPNITIFVKTLPDALSIIACDIDAAHDRATLHLDYRQSMLTLYFMRKSDRDICVFPSSMPGVDCLPPSGS